MRIKVAKRVHYESGPNMTPLVDVVMVILIFLMLAGSFGANSWFLTSNLPVRGVGKVDPGIVPPDEVVEIRIIGEGGGFRVLSDSIDSRGLVPTREWLVERLRERKVRLESFGKTSVEQIQVVLAPTSTARYEHIALVYEAALKAQFKKVAFRTSQ
jgi:biopolymer transport protein ExbD